MTPNENVEQAVQSWKEDYDVLFTSPAGDSLVRLITNFIEKAHTVIPNENVSRILKDIEDSVMCCIHEGIGDPETPDDLEWLKMYIVKLEEVKNNASAILELMDRFESYGHVIDALRKELAALDNDDNEKEG